MAIDLIKSTTKMRNLAKRIKQQTTALFFTFVFFCVFSLFFLFTSKTIPQPNAGSRGRKLLRPRGCDGTVQRAFRHFWRIRSWVWSLFHVTGTKLRGESSAGIGRHARLRCGELMQMRDDSYHQYWHAERGHVWRC